MKMTAKVKMLGMLTSAVAALVGTEAQAGLSCVEKAGNSTLELRDRQRLPGVILKVADAQVHFIAHQTEDTGGVLYSESNYDLTGPENELALLSVISRVPMGRGGCGRGGCDQGPGRIITAKLTYHELETYFSCTETRF